MICDPFGAPSNAAPPQSPLPPNVLGAADMRLVGGLTPFQGRVELLLHGNWGTICDDEFDLADAQVVCRQLGYGPAIAVRPRAFFGRGYGEILLDDLACRGD